MIQEKEFRFYLVVSRIQLVLYHRLQGNLGGNNVILTLLPFT